jgi:hypothetical protein
VRGILFYERMKWEVRNTKCLLVSIQVCKCKYASK